MLDAVYVDARESKCIVAVKPKPPFRPIFQVALTVEGSGIVLAGERPTAPFIASGLVPVKLAAN